MTHFHAVSVGHEVELRECAANCPPDEKRHYVPAIVPPVPLYVPPAPVKVAEATHQIFNVYIVAGCASCCQNHAPGQDLDQKAFKNMTFTTNFLEATKQMDSMRRVKSVNF